MRPSIVLNVVLHLSQCPVLRLQGRPLSACRGSPFTHGHGVVPFSVNIRWAIDKFASTVFIQSGSVGMCLLHCYAGIGFCYGHSFQKADFLLVWDMLFIMYTNGYDSWHIPESASCIGA